MNQIRNLWINVLINITFCTGLYYFLNILYNTMTTQERLQTMPLTGAWVLILFLTCVANFAVSALTYTRELNEGTLYLLPPLSGVILIFIGINYLFGNIKKISTVDYSYIGRYYNNKVYYYFFTPFCMYRSGYDSYGGSDYDMRTIKESLRKIHVDYLSETVTPKDKFKKWDGALDAETKRINTINNIIE